MMEIREEEEVVRWEGEGAREKDWRKWLMNKDRGKKNEGAYEGKRRRRWRARTNKARGRSGRKIEGSRRRREKENEGSRRWRNTERGEADSQHNSRFNKMTNSS